MGIILTIMSRRFHVVFEMFCKFIQTVRREYLTIFSNNEQNPSAFLNLPTALPSITNFCLGQHLPSEQDRLRDQRGSPAYISPDVLSGKPYLGKKNVFPLGGGDCEHCSLTVSFKILRHVCL